MNKIAFAAAITLGFGHAVGTAATPDMPPGILGYSPRAAAAQRDVEKKYRAIPSADEARKWHRHLTSVPHPATSKANDEQAEYIAAQWKAQGLEDVVIHRYDVLSSNPPRGRSRWWRRCATCRRCGRILSRGSGHQTSGHQRRLALVLGLGRCHGAGRLRQQRQPRRLRRAAQERDRSERQDRHRPLLEPLQLSRLQGADGAA